MGLTPKRAVWGDLTGAFGDLGTLLPLALGLIVYNGISPGPAFVLLGVTYIITGLYYRLPVPVQPLKATAMIAIATGATRPQLAAAAFLIAGILLILSITRLVDRINALFPIVIVRGLQFGLGLLMIKTAAKLAIHYDVGLGATLKGLHAASSHGFPSLVDFRIALVALVLPQIPLTLGNAVVATRDCAVKYFGDRGERVTAGRLAMTMGIGNIAAGLVGGVPICHGAGGMTAHYRLGARTGVMGLIIGSTFVIGGLTGAHLLPMISSIPAGILAVLLGFSGVRHSMLAKGELSRLRTGVVVVVMGIISLITGNMLLSLVSGIAMSCVTKRLARGGG